MTLCPKTVNPHCDHKVHDKLTTGKWRLGVSDDRNTFLSSLKIMTLKYLISRYEKSQIQIISLSGLPQIFPTNVPVLHSHVPFFTQWCHERPEVDSLGQITQLCLWQLSEWNMSQGPTKNKIFPSVKSAALPGPKEVFPLIWFLWFCICQAFNHNSWPVLMASGKSSRQKLHLELFSLQDRWILFGIRWTSGQFIYCYKWRRIFLTPVKMCQCTK